MITTERVCSPYQQLEVISSRDLILKTPWLTLTIDEVSGHKLHLDGVLQSLQRYPICYIHPSEKSKPERPSLEPWDADGVLRFASMGWGRFDNLAAFSVIRRDLYSDSMNGEEYGLIDDLRKLKESQETFREAVAIYLYQRYYMARHCVGILEAARQSLPAIEFELQDYIISEVGHDHLTKQALQVLGVSDPNQLPVFPETGELLFLLRRSADYGVLPFAAMLELFEMGGHNGRQPLAQLLAGTEYAAASHPLLQHRMINSANTSTRVSYDLLHQVPISTRVEVQQAVWLTERAQLTKRRLVQRLRERFCFDTSFGQGTSNSVA